MSRSERLSTEAIEARIVDWCNAYDLVRAAILTSTRAVASGDQYPRDLDDRVIAYLRRVQADAGGA